VCLAAARGAVLRRVGWNAEAKGLFGAPPIHVVIGDDAHTSVFSALQFLGLGHDRVLRVPTDAQGRMQSTEVAVSSPAVPAPRLRLRRRATSIPAPSIRSTRLPPQPGDPAPGSMSMAHSDSGRVRVR
jgi:hypothetical protein